MWSDFIFVLFKAWLKSKVSKEFSLPSFPWLVLVASMPFVCVVKRDLVSGPLIQCFVFVYFFVLSLSNLVVFILSYAPRGQYPVWAKWKVSTNVFVHRDVIWDHILFCVMFEKSGSDLNKAQPNWTLMSFCFQQWS